MYLMNYMKKYYRLKNGMEMSGLKFGLNDQRTIGFSKELDSVVNEIMKIKYPTNTKGKESMY